MRKLLRFLGSIPDRIGSIPYHFTAWHVLWPVLSVGLSIGTISFVALVLGQSPEVAVRVSAVFCGFLGIALFLGGLPIRDEPIKRSEKESHPAPKLWVYPAVLCFAQFVAVSIWAGTFDTMRLWIAGGAFGAAELFLLRSIFARFRLVNQSYDTETREWKRHLPPPHSVLAMVLVSLLAGLPSYLVGQCALWYLDHPNTWLQFAEEPMGGKMLLLPTMGLAFCSMLVAAFVLDLLVRPRSVPEEEYEEEEAVESMVLNTRF